jgi:hypothetical protein
MSIIKQTRKLTLNRETLLRLDTEELEHVNGGIGWPSTVCQGPTVGYCTTRHLRTHLNCAGGI